MRRLLSWAALLLALVIGAGRETQAGVIYWPEKGRDGTGGIARANADGTGHQTLVTGLNQPAGIALDVTGGRMYWADFGPGDPGQVGDIRRANLEGAGQETLVSGMRPIGIALDVVG